ncbi:MAG: Coenzyme synthesis protein (PqqD) [Flavipsychrobacter sp.]|nr:Coenzyme synthesis protein (PqqD) [Flavipsychrobacter sp.]
MLANDIGAETVMMNPEAGRYFGMNKTGSYIWKQLVTSMTFADLCAQLSANFNIPEQQCKDETRPFIAEMAKETILLVS